MSDKRRKFGLAKKIAITFILLILVATGTLTFARVSGSSMRPTFNNGTFGISVRQSRYDYGDVVLAKVTIDGKEYEIIKRVMGKYGDSIKLQGSNCYINGVISDWHFETDGDLRHTVVSDYYLLGDNRSESTDSRYFGDVSKDQIYGKYYDIASSNTRIALVCVVIFALVVAIV